MDIVNDSDVMMNMTDSNTQQNDEEIIDHVYDSIVNVGNDELDFSDGEPDTHVNADLDVDEVYNSAVNGGNQGLEMAGDDEGESSNSGMESELVPAQETPNGSLFWVPDVPEELKPIVGSMWESTNAAYLMYEKYAEKAGFGVRKSSSKYRNGEMTHKYFLCHKSGKPKTKYAADTLAGDVSKTGRVKRNSNYTVTDCKALIKLTKVKGTESFRLFGFEEKHNHPLVDEHSKHLSRARRQLTFGDQLFIQTVSTNNIGPTKAYRLRAAMMGGYDKVRGTVVDYKNFKMKINMYIGDRDAQMLVDKFKNRVQCLPEFSFDFKTGNNGLTCLFWADETSKCNYKEFGDVLAFDATYNTNKYNMVFVPFTGVDNHNRCVTFGAGLLSKEDFESYSWLLKAFLNAHNKQPSLVLTDQDGAMKKAVKAELPNSQHRLCMWHIMKKLPLKVCGDLLENTDLRQRLHKLVWNIFLKPKQFVKRWKKLIKEFNLEDNKWLARMFKQRRRWIPAYFVHMPMCCLTKTTSRSESSNSFFKIFSHYKHTLVQFMLCFETAMEKQRHAQRVLDDHTTTTFPKMLTPTPIEVHASQIYTRTIFLKVQMEIYKGCWSCSQISVTSDGIDDVYLIKHSSKPCQENLKFTVVRNVETGSITCSCNHFGRHGYLCRHIFCVFKQLNVSEIPEDYISRRWRRDVLPRHLLHHRHRYGNMNDETSKTVTKALEDVESCFSRLRHQPEKLSDFVSKLNTLTGENLFDVQQVSGKQDQNLVFQELLGVTEPVEVTILPPEVAKTKGSGTPKGKRIKGQAEKHVKKRKRQMRECKYCHEIQDQHDQRNCPIKLENLASERAAKRARIEAVKPSKKAKKQAAVDQTL